MSSSGTAQVAEGQNGKTATPQDSFQAFNTAMRTAIEQANNDITKAESEPRRILPSTPTHDAMTARGPWPPESLRNVPLKEPTHTPSPTTGPSDPAPESSSSESPPHTPLRYTISPALRAKARSYPSLHPSSYWTHTLYRGPPPDNPKVIVHYCRSLSTAEKICQLFLPPSSPTDPPPVLGFDIEWRPSASSSSPLRHNVSVVQLATEERIAVFHLALFSGPNAPSALVPPTLKHIMESPVIRKVGVAIKGDCTRLRTHLGIHARSIFELSHLYKLVKYSSTDETSKINKRLVSLQTQVEEHLELPLYKGGDVRGSDWSRELGMQQVEYAAADSYAGLVLWDVLERKRRASRPCPPQPWNADLNLPIRLADGEVVGEKAPAAVDEVEEPVDEDDDGESEEWGGSSCASSDEMESAPCEGEQSASSEGEGVETTPPTAAATAQEREKVTYPTLPETSLSSVDVEMRSSMSNTTSVPSAATPSDDSDEK